MECKLGPRMKPRTPSKATGAARRHFIPVLTIDSRHHDSGERPLASPGQSRAPMTPGGQPATRPTVRAQQRRRREAASRRQRNAYHRQNLRLDRRPNAGRRPRTPMKIQLTMTSDLALSDLNRLGTVLCDGPNRTPSLLTTNSRTSPSWKHRAKTPPFGLGPTATQQARQQ